MTEQRVVVVTGGSSGLGAALVAHFIAAGDAVAMNYRDDAKAEAQSALLQPHGAADRLLAIRADVSQRAEVRDMFDRTVERFGRVDVLISCAGLNRDAPIMEMTDADWDVVVGSHLKGSFICAQEFVFHNTSAPGHIVNLGAACALQGRLNGANFCSAKAGVIGLTKCLALELAPRIQVNCLIPGSVDTQEVRHRYNLDTTDGLTKVVDGIPMARLGALDDVVHMVESILGARFTTGENFFVNGGEYMQ